MASLPEFDFSGFYYSDILKSLHKYLERNAPELALSSEYELGVQLVRAFALVGHLNNVRLNQVAREAYLSTARLPSTVRALLELIGYRPKEDVPASVDVLLKLSKVFYAAEQFISRGALAETNPAQGEAAVSFEFTRDRSLSRTDRLSAVRTRTLAGTYVGAAAYVTSEDPQKLFNPDGALPSIGGVVEIYGSQSDLDGVYVVVGKPSSTQVILRAEDGSVPAFPGETGIRYRYYNFVDVTTACTGQGGSAAVPRAAGGCLYAGHVDVMPTSLQLTMGVVTGSGVAGVWEYWDADGYRGAPDAVVNNGDSLTFDLSTFLGGSSRAGTLVEVRHRPSGARSRGFSSFAAGNELTLPGLLGQSVPSTAVDDYELTTRWTPFPEVVDGTSALGEGGTVSWTLPQNAERNWGPVEVDGSAAYWARFRVVSASSPGAAAVTLVDPTVAEQWVLEDAVQGRTVEEQLAVSDGSVSQQYNLVNKRAAEGSLRVSVGGELWSAVRTLAEASAASKQYETIVSGDGTTTVRFGDGINGRVPAAGAAVSASYRVDAAADGNIGTGTLTVNGSGIPYVEELTNPRPGVGWKSREGSTAASLNDLKRRGPASLRTLERAVTADDAAVLAREYEAADGTSPVLRARSFEEVYGPKTVELVVVGAGGGFLSRSDLSNLESYFNGSSTAGGVFAVNHELTARNYERRLVPVRATVYWKGGSRTAVENALLALLHPLAVDSESGEYVWDFAATVPLSRVYSAIHAVSPSIRRVVLTDPAEDLTLGQRELPLLDVGNFVISVVD